MHCYLQLSQRSTRTVLYCRSILLVFVRSCSSMNNKIISLKNLFHHSQLGAPQKEKILGPWARAQCAHWLRGPWMKFHHSSVYKQSKFSSYAGRRSECHANPIVWIGPGFGLTKLVVTSTLLPLADRKTNIKRHFHSLSNAEIPLLQRVQTNNQNSWCHVYQQ